MDPITKRNAVIALLVIFGLPISGGSGYAVGQDTKCPSVHRVEVKPDPCICECIFAQDCPTPQPLPPAPVPEPCPEADCPTVEIVPAGHYLGPVGGWADGWVAGVGYSYVRPKWALEATAGHRWADGELVDVYSPAGYRTWARRERIGDDGPLLLASFKWRLR